MLLGVPRGDTEACFVVFKCSGDMVGLAGEQEFVIVSSASFELFEMF
jgi:hypothetical protein